MKRERILFTVIALALVCTFVRRLFPVAEMPSPGENLLAALCELGMTVGLVGLGIRILKESSPELGGRGKWVVLFGAGVAAALGILVIRLTGGPRVELPARPALSGTLPPEGRRNEPESLPQSKPAAPAFNPLGFTMIMELKTVIETNDKRFEEMAATRWSGIIVGNDVAQRRTLTREDLGEQLQKHGAVLETVDQALSLFKKADDKGISLAGALDNDPKGRPEVWRVLRAFISASEKYHKIIERNWEDWRTNGTSPRDGKAKRWQEEAMQAGREMDARHQEMKELHK